MKLWTKFKALFARHQLEREMAEEMEAHIDGLTERSLAKGLSPEEARYAALREFGGVEQIKERARDERGWIWVEQLLQDVRYGLRQLRRSPGFTAIAVVSLALGIGANTALFSLIDEILLRSLPVKNPGELVLFRWLSNDPPLEGIVGRSLTDATTGLTMDTALPLPIYEALSDHSEVMSDTFAFAPLAGLLIQSDIQIGHGRGQFVTGDYFSSLGVSAWRGRMIVPADDQPGAAPVAVISYRFWQENLGGDEEVLGKVIRVNRHAVTVVGIMPRGFIGALQAGQAPDVTLPLSIEPYFQKDRSFTKRPHIWWLHIMGRLRPGVDRQQAQALLEPIFLRVIDAARKDLSSKGTGQKVEPRDMLRLEAGGQGLADIRQTYRQPLAILMAMVGLVLLLACFNVANLLLARAKARRREIALRLSLGATRGRVIRQLLIESCLLAGMGGMFGIFVAWWGRQGLLKLWKVGDLDALVIDHRILAFTLLVSLLTGLVFGLAPAWQTARVDLNAVLKGAGLGHSRSWLRAGLTVAQIAFAMVLLMGAGLFAGTLRNLRAIDAGFNRDNLVIFNLNARELGYSEQQTVQLFERIQARLSTLPAVRSVAFSNTPLLVGKQSGSSIQFDSPRFPAGKWHSTGTNSVSPEFRRTMEIPLLAGRDLTEQDKSNSPPVILINELFAKTYFPGENPVGRQVTFRGSSAFKTENRTFEVVGVVGDTRYSDLRRAMGPIAFMAYAQSTLMFGDAAFVVRADGNQAGLGDLIRTVVREMEPALPVGDLRTQEGQIDRLFARERLFALLAGCFGVLALMLTCLGLYGLLANDVEARTREIGIRMAIGAQHHQIIGLVMRTGLGLTMLGCLIGIAGAIASGRLIAQFLYGVTAADPKMSLAAALFLLTVAGLACWCPARRAAKVDPMVALRAE